MPAIKHFSLGFVAALAILLYTGVSAGQAGQRYPDIPNVELVAVYDGDTFTVNLPSCHPILREHIRVRVAGIDTPELRGSHLSPCQRRAALAAKAHTERLLRSARSITLVNPRRDKYFRILADVLLLIPSPGRDTAPHDALAPARAVDLAHSLLASHYAVEYHSGPRPVFTCTD